MPEQLHNLDRIKYHKNFITQVIIRIDFENSIDFIRDKLPTLFMRNIKKKFHIFTVTQKETKEFKLFKGKNMEQKSIITFNEWEFVNPANESTLIINHNTLILSQKKYNSYEEMVELFRYIYQEFIQIPHVNFVIKRLGLRYINEIKLKRMLNTAKKYFVANLLSFIDNKLFEGDVLRIFHILEMNYGEFRVKFQYGLPNLDYPAILTDKLFVLDFDAVNLFSVEKDDIYDCLEKYHKQIQKIFEGSIKQEFRAILNA